MSKGRAWFFVVVLPLSLLWFGALLWEQTPGASAQEGTTSRPSLTTRGPTTTRPPEPTLPSTTIDRDPHPTGTGGPGTGPTTTVTSIQQPGTTYMPPTSGRWTPDDGNGNGLNPPGTGVYFYRNGARWICWPKEATPGTYCIDP